MSFLRNKLTNVVTAELSPESPAYRALIALRTTSAHTITPDPAVAMEEGGPYTVQAGESIWEEIPSERASAFANRALVGVLDAAAVAADTRAILSRGLENDITITKVALIPNASIKGADTNSRTVSIIDVTEAASPVTAAKAALVAGVESPAGEEKELTLEEAAKLKVKAGANVVADSKHVGTGIADPGGIVLVTYTHD